MEKRVNKQINTYIYETVLGSDTCYLQNVSLGAHCNKVRRQRAYWVKESPKGQKSPLSEVSIKRDCYEQLNAKNKRGSLEEMDKFLET